MVFKSLELWEPGFRVFQLCRQIIRNNKIKAVFC